MREPGSRYEGIETAELVLPEGRRVTYLRRRFLPRPEELPTLVEVTVDDGDRLDLIADRTLGDALLSWRVADANAVLHPAELTREPGRRLRVPVPGLTPPGAVGP